MTPRPPRRANRCRRRGATGWALAGVALAGIAGSAIAEPVAEPSAGQAAGPIAEPMAGQALDGRIMQLEAQVRALLERVQALEASAAVPVVASAADDGVVWTFGDPVDGSPLKVSYKGLDRNAGSVELLVQVTAPLADPAAWTASPPLRVTLHDVDGGSTEARFALVRGSRVDPGAHLHLRATVDPARAAAARQLVIGGAD